MRREPVGVVGAIVPWNFPFCSRWRSYARALTGCTVVLKPAEETPLYAFLLAEVFEEAGLPAGVLNVVPADRMVSEDARQASARRQDQLHRQLAAGSRIGSMCGVQLKRCALELGGKSAAIILDDADLDAAIPRLAPATITTTARPASTRRACRAQRHYDASSRR